MFGEEILFGIRLDPMETGGEDLSTGIQKSSETAVATLCFKRGLYHSTASFVTSV